MGVQKVKGTSGDQHCGGAEGSHGVRGRGQRTVRRRNNKVEGNTIETNYH